MSSLIVVPWARRMAPRDPTEAHRVSTPLELFFDLVFVVAISSAAAQWHHGLSAGHFDAAVGFVLVFFAIWWAWMSFTWFASSYDCDDVVYRLLTFVIMTGSLMLAAGVPDLFDDEQSGLVVAGYAVMRLGMVAMWLRAARDHPEGRRTALTYAVGITVVQLLWVARLLLDGRPVLLSTFLLLVLAELAVPVTAERLGAPTPFHPHHVAERYGLFTIIVLGEVVLASVQAIQQALAAPSHGSAASETVTAAASETVTAAVSEPVGAASDSAGAAATGAAPVGISGSLVMLILGGLLLVFSLWWLYFKREHVDLIGQGRRLTWAFGYAHVVVFAAVAAVGAALAASVDVVEHVATTGSRAVGLALAVPVALYALTLSGLHAAADHDASVLLPSAAMAVGVLLVALPGADMGLTVLLVGAVAAAAVAQHVVASHRRLPTASPDVAA